MSQADTQLDTTVATRIATPPRWQVIFINDDTTPMEFITTLLVTIFKHDPDTAVHIMLKIHEEGAGVAGVYSFEIAEQKAIESSTLAKNAGYPLKIKLEEE
jgi:ATP-dependent Clp protease adaptor protein ClpS